MGRRRGRREFYRPAPRAATALLRGSGSCTIVSGRREGGCRAPAPPPPARAISEGPGGGGGAGSKVARSHRGSGPASPSCPGAAPSTRIFLGFCVSWLGSLTVFWNVALPTRPHLRQVDRGVRYHLSLRGSGNYCPGEGAVECGGRKVTSKMRERDKSCVGRTLFEISRLKQNSITEV